MINVQDFIEKGNLFKKIKVEELLFTEIKCPVEDDVSSGNLWWHDHFFSYAMAGEMVLKTINSEYIFKAGDCIFAKKGSLVSARHRIQEDFCELRVFVPDEFIRSVVQKHMVTLPEPEAVEDIDLIIPLTNDEVLHDYFNSLFTHFIRSTPPPKILMKLKFEELLVHVLSAHEHRPLRHFISGICHSTRPSIPEIMEANFIKNLALQEFSRLCGRSLSSFKTAFKKIYHTSPGHWLRGKRLEYACYLLETTDKQVDEICYQSGFENRSHFARVFKNKYGLAPAKYKMEHNHHNQ